MKVVCRKVESGERQSGFFTMDFSWDEIQTLRARQRFSFRDHQYDDLYKVLSLSLIVSNGDDLTSGAKSKRSFSFSQGGKKAIRQPSRRLHRN